MLHDASILEPLLDSSELPELMHQLESRWRDEQARRAEFYEKIQPGDKWEFINGKTIMHSPAKQKHTQARQRLSLMLQIYVSLNDDGVVLDETALVVFHRNDYLPDIAYFSKEKAAAFQPNTWKCPAPDFVVEVLSDSTTGADRGIKKKDYAANGVAEYWLVDPDEQSVEQFVLDEGSGQYRLFSKKTFDDEIESRAVTGMRFTVAAIFDEAAKLAAVRRWMEAK